MTNTGKTTLRNGNIRAAGRPKDAVNKYRKEMLRIGEENCLSLYQTYLEMATNDPDKETRRKCHEFLLDKVMPKPAPLPHRTYIEIPLLSMDSIEDIKENEKILLKYVCNGDISLEEGKELFSMTEQARKTYETTEIAKMLSEIDDRMKENGI